MKAETAVHLDPLKGAFDFRLGTSSYILPADLLPNVTFLADKLDDVELVLFESHEVSNLPDADTLASLARLSREHDLSYTVHLPLDADLGDGDEDVRQRSVAKCLKVIDLTRTLHPFGYVLHLHGQQRGPVPAEDIEAWRARLRRSLDELLSHAAVTPGDLCVETLDYPYALVEDLVVDCNLSICLDVGHVLLAGYDLDAYLDRYLKRTRILHLHGIRQGCDHCDIAALSLSVLTDLVERLRDGTERVLTLEIFELCDLQQSLDVMRIYQ